MKFRQQPKASLRVLVPVDIEDVIRDMSKNRSLSEVTTELLCLGLSRNPGDYGIKPKPRRTPVPAA